MDKNNHRRLLRAGLATCLLAALALPPGAFAGVCSRDPEPDVVAVDPINNAIVFSPLEGFEAMVLSVTGPFEYSFVQEVGPDQNAVFELDAPNTADGCYTWEVRIDPILDGEILAALASARDSGDYSQVRALMRSGTLPDRARVQSGAFQVVGGSIILGGGPPEQGQARTANEVGTLRGTREGPAGAADVPRKDYVVNDDLIVDGSTCVGHDCFNGWTFDFTTFAVSENNTRIKFDDTSYLASYPNNDWQLKANEASNGGAERFSIIDCGDNDAQGYCSGGTVFSVEAGAPGAALYVDDQGRVGFGTPTPYYELHVVDGDTPTLRLAQDGSLGFTPQTFDVAANEANFFIRDATNGSKLPLRLKPGAPTDSIYVDSDGDVGLGTGSPDASLEVVRSSGGQLVMLNLENNGPVQTEFQDTGNGVTWRFGMNNAGDFVLNDTADLGTAEFQVTTAGVVSVNGTQVHPDYVFAPDYRLMPLDELAAFVAANRHLPNVQSAAEREQNNGRIILNELPLQILEKVEELVLYTIAQHRTVARQQQIVDRLSEENSHLKRRLEALEARLFRE